MSEIATDNLRFMPALYSMDHRPKGMDSRSKRMHNRPKGMDNRAKGMDNRARVWIFALIA
jgi:hypothetical protein